MAKKKVISTTDKKKLEPTKSRVSKSKSSSTSSSGTAKAASSEMLFKKENYYWMFGGIGLIILGFILMSGGHMPNDDTWDPDLIYSFRRITLAPIVILAGLAFQIVAIFKK
jgi:hypothetical protein